MGFQKVKIPYKIIVNSDMVILVGVAPQFAYENGKKTEEIIGTRYFVVETTTFEKFVVKVPTIVPKISQDFLEKSKGKTYVRFTNCFGVPYSNGRSVEWSFTASSIELVERTQQKEV